MLFVQLLYIIISTGLIAVIARYELFTDRNIRDHLSWIIWNGDPMHGVYNQHRIPRA